MSIHPDTHERVTKLQKDVEEIKEELEDQWHERRQVYQDRVRRCLDGDENAAILYLEIDGWRSVKEIENELIVQNHAMPHVSLWRASKKLVKSGLVKKLSIKGKSPVYAKKPWANVLDIDVYVRTEILHEEQTAS